MHSVVENFDLPQRAQSLKTWNLCGNRYFFYGIFWIKKNRTPIGVLPSFVLGLFSDIFIFS